MSNIWFTGDHHFGHKNILKFTRDDGSRLRDFHSIHEMNMVLIDNWNSVVKDSDIVYHLGDFCFNKKLMPFLQCLHGQKRLIRGNHDKFQLPLYRTVFKEIYGVRLVHQYVLTHVPIHPACMWRDRKNIHGHIHYRRIKDEDGHIDNRYINVSVENTNYMPVSIDEVENLVLSATENEY